MGGIIINTHRTDTHKRRILKVQFLSLFNGQRTNRHVFWDMGWRRRDRMQGEGMEEEEHDVIAEHKS